MAKLINGNGNPAIYAGEDADLIASLAGNVTCIANVGNKYAATEEDANTIGLADGVIITKEGRRIQLDAGGTDLFTIPTGSSGVTNYYIIGYKLVQNDDSTQVAEKFVQKMSSSSETITENTFRGGATEVYVSLYRVTQVGFDITAVDGLLPTLLDNSAIKDDITQINNDLDALPVSAGSTDFRGTKLRATNSDGSAFSPIEGSSIRANNGYFQTPYAEATFTDYTGLAYAKINCKSLFVKDHYISTDAETVSITNVAGNTLKKINVSDVNIGGTTSVKATTDLNLPNWIKTYSITSSGGVAWAPVNTDVTYLVFWNMNGVGTGIAKLCMSASSVLQAVEISPNSYFKFEDAFNITVSTAYGLQLGFTARNGSSQAKITLVHFNDPG